MNFFGIGGWEWIIIAIAALVVFGPGKLPEVAGQAGRAVRDFRRMTSDLTGEFEKSLNESGAGELRKTFDKELRGMRGQVESVGKSVERDLKKTGVTGSATKKSSSTSAKATTAVKKAPGKTSTASSSASTASSGSAKSTSSASRVQKAAAVVERKATKADPLADVSFMDESETTDAARPAASRSTASRNGSARPMASGGAALARVRERRINAGYSRGRVS